MKTAIIITVIYVLCITILSIYLFHCTKPSKSESQLRWESFFKECDAKLMALKLTHGHGSFEDCYFLKSITMPKNVTLGNEAFKNCTQFDDPKFKEFLKQKP
jgi:hypothetical protein